MTDSSQSEPGNDNNCKGNAGHCGRRRGRGALFVVGVLLLGALGGVFATKAISHGRGMHHGGPMGHMGKMYGPMDPEKAAKRAERMVKHFAVAVDATPEQTEKLAAIANSLAKDLLPLRKDIRTTRRAAVDMLSSDNVDRTALEKLRTDQMSRLEDVSKRALSALADASEVLTPKQRAQVRERVQEWREARHGWGRGWGHHRGHGWGHKWGKGSGSGERDFNGDDG